MRIQSSQFRVHEMHNSSHSVLQCGGFGCVLEAQRVDLVGSGGFEGQIIGPSMKEMKEDFLRTDGRHSLSLIKKNSYEFRTKKYKCTATSRVGSRWGFESRGDWEIKIIAEVKERVCQYESGWSSVQSRSRMNRSSRRCSNGRSWQEDINVNVTLRI